jgi:hypothetical protein
MDAPTQPSGQEQTCVCCGQTKHQDLFGSYFAKGVRKYKLKCKDCLMAYQREYMAKKRAARDTGKPAPRLFDEHGNITAKRCKDCGEYKPLDEFARAAGTKDGKAVRCHDCDKERVRQWRLANVERSRATVKAYQAAHKDEVKARNAKWRDENREHLRAWQRAHYERNREAIRQYMREWAQRNPNKVADAKERQRIKYRARAEADRQMATIMDVPLPEWRRAELQPHWDAQKVRWELDYRNAWRKANPEKAKASTARWKALNRDELRTRWRAKAAEWRATPEGREENRRRSQEWRAAYPDRVKASSVRYYEANKDKVSAQKRRWVERNWEHHRSQQREYRSRPGVAERRRDLRDIWVARNQEYLKRHRLKRRGRRLPWVSKLDLLPAYWEARRLSRKTGVKHEVDHIYPLISEYVCGLDVPANQRVITQFENRSKGNKILDCLLPEMCDVAPWHIHFTTEEQQRVPLHADTLKETSHA